MDKHELTDLIKRKGLELGFTHVGIAPVIEYDEYDELVHSRPECEPFIGLLGRLSHPLAKYPDARSVICATWGYSNTLYPESLLPYVARTYQSRSYVPQQESQCGARDNEYRRFLTELGMPPYRDAYAVPERWAAAMAGIITFGRNNFAYTEEDGAYNIIYTYIVDAELDYDEPTLRCDCPPDCHACIDACPTHAIKEAGYLEPMRCVLANNMKPLRDDSEEIWPLLGTRIHGCDVCQEVCPRSHAALKRASRPDPLLERIAREFDLEKVLEMDEAFYEWTIKPIAYNYIRDMDIFRRNAAIAMGNSGETRYIPTLERALATTENDELMRAATWALERLRA